MTPLANSPASLASRVPSIPPGSADRAHLAAVEEVLFHFEKLEAQLSKVRDGLTHSHRLTTLGTLASVIAHEYNNILTPIISYAQLALATPDDADLMRKAVEKALAGAERAAKVSTSILGFARDGDEERTADLRATLHEAIACLGRDPAKDGLNITIEVPDVTIALAPVSLQQITINLILNAQKAMRRSGGLLAVTGRVLSDVVELRFRDTGPGIPSEILDRLFEPFVTHGIGDTSDPVAPKGTGLGLCICRDLLRAAGGDITVESEPSRGATFTLTIPLAPSPIEST